MTLLPPNATRLERALEAATARIADVEAPIADLWNPDACPAVILPWLAWGLSVDSWDPAWSEATKRRAVADSIDLHRRKGTRQSVETVLARFDDLIDLVEWHQAVPPLPPHSFDVVVPMVLADGTAPGGHRASAAFAEAIIRDVARVKPLREHLRLVQQVVAAGAIGIQGVVRVLSYDRADADVIVDTSPEWAAYLQTEDGEPIEASDGIFLDTRP